MIILNQNIVLKPQQNERVHTQVSGRRRSKQKDGVDEGIKLRGKETGITNDKIGDDPQIGLKPNALI